MRWTLKPKADHNKVNSLAKSLAIPHAVANLLVQRDVETFEDAKQFFRPSLKQLHDPFLMTDMAKATSRIERALVKKERILVYGDYDVDGTTSVALMSSYLKTRTTEVATYIPDRYDEGYGVSYKGIDFAHDNGITLIIALDCGIKAIEKVAYATQKGIDFIICDHHRPGINIPEAVAVLDPKREDCNYPYKELCGCGVGFKLIQALHQNEGGDLIDIVPYLDLVATAIGADIVPITGENRILAYHGLHVINSAPRAGFYAIIKQVKKERLTITDVVFIIAPRINAAGRMKHGNHAVTLLTETDHNQAARYAIEIETFNSDRKEADRNITEEALLQIKTNKEENRKTTVVYDATWHKGVIGIVASRLTETYYRPTLVFTKSGNKLAASARSVKGFDVYEALEQCSEYIEQFGGHKYAAGLTLVEENFEKFKSKFESVVSSTIHPHLLTREINIDTELKLEDITPKFYRLLKQFAPFGPGNMHPTFLTKGVKDTGYGKCVGQDDLHLKLAVQPAQASKANTNGISTIGFNLGHKCDLIKDKNMFDIVYSLDENHWNGTVKLQLKLKDLKAS